MQSRTKQKQKVCAFGACEVLTSNDKFCSHSCYYKSKTKPRSVCNLEGCNNLGNFPQSKFCSQKCHIASGHSTCKQCDSDILRHRKFCNRDCFAAWRNNKPNRQRICQKCRIPKRGYGPRCHDCSIEYRRMNGPVFRVEQSLSKSNKPLDTDHAAAYLKEVGHPLVSADIIEDLGLRTSVYALANKMNMDPARRFIKVTNYAHHANKWALTCWNRVCSFGLCKRQFYSRHIGNYCSISCTLRGRFK